MPTRNGRDQSDPNSGIPRLKVAAAPMPRTALPQHETPGSVETGQDDDLPEVIERLLEFCVERDLPPNSPMDEVAEQFLAEHAGGKDAGPPRPNIDDEQPPDDEIDRVMEHIVRSPEAASRLLEKLRASDLPAFLKGREGELERIAEPLDRHSASDMHEFNNAMDQMEEEARKLMRSRGQFEAPVGRTMRGLRDVGPWHPGKGEPPGEDLPRPAGKPHVPGSLVPKMASDKSFARLMGVKPKKLRKQLPRVLE